ncbi:MAG: ABC transporter permease [Actinomyces sp.]|nr:MAG: ABC transporter permease [Actinomyces sp.]
MIRRVALTVAAPVAATVLAVVVSSLVLVVSGSNPLDAYANMWEYGTRLETLVDTLNRATPLYISGVAAAIGFRMNLFNIGVEGQYVIAAFFAAHVGGHIALWAPLHVTVILVVAMTVGALWGAIPGVLKVTRGVNEVISTIMLNTIAVAGVVAFLLPRWQQKDDTLNTATKTIPESGRMPDLNSWLELVTREIGKGRELTGVLLVAVAVGVAYHLFINRTRVGFDFRATGWNPFAARASGVPEKRTIVLAMVLSGLVAGLVGMPDILSDKFKYDQAFVQGLGFAGIGVALLGRNHPAGIAVGALLFAFLDASAVVLDVKGDASREIVIIMQGVILLSAVVAYEVVRRVRQRDEARAAAAALANAGAGADTVSTAEVAR